MSDIMETDVLVVGAGPAGSTVARYAAEKGLDVTLIERRKKIGIPVRCGEFMPDVSEIKAIFPSATDLDELFNIPPSLRRRDIGAIRVVTPKGRSYDNPFQGYSTDRDRFDQYLASEAVSAGAELITSCAFIKAADGLYQTSKGTFRAKVIVGADGPGSRVAREMGLPLPKHPYPAVAAQAEGDFEPVLTMFFGGIAPGAYGWIIPKDGSANVGVGCSPKLADLRPSDYFYRFVETHDLNVTSRISGKYVPAQGPIKPIYDEGAITVGDAAGHVMAVNGGGIPLAMIAGRTAADVLEKHIVKGGPISLYQERLENTIFGPLRSAARTKWLADVFAFGSDFRTEWCMRTLGRRRISKILRCRFPFP